MCGQRNLTSPSLVATFLSTTVAMSARSVEPLHLSRIDEREGPLDIDTADQAQYNRANSPWLSDVSLPCWKRP
jgi:hypothetical protein